jgi:hypothetical protein
VPVATGGDVPGDAIGTGYSHYNFLTSAEVPRIVDRVLTGPMTAGDEEHIT